MATSIAPLITYDIIIPRVSIIKEAWCL
jgi:hypothetical protein